MSGSLVHMLNLVASQPVLGPLLRLPLRLIPKEAVLPILQGPLRGVRWIVGSGNHSCWLGTYEPWIQAEFVRSIHRADVVYDLGANVGLYTLLASRLGATVIAVEPHPSHLVYLRRHLRLNRCGDVHVIEGAVLDVEGPTYIEGTGGEAHLADQGQPISGTTLDGMIRSQPVPTFIKCDVEGAELRVLHGATMLLRRHHPRWVLSTHSRSLREACLAILTASGYVVRVVHDKDGDHLVAD